MGFVYLFDFYRLTPVNINAFDVCAVAKPVNDRPLLTNNKFIFTLSF